MDSDDNSYYNSDENNSQVEEDYNYFNEEVIESKNSEKNYRVLSETDIQKKIWESVASVSSVLSVSESAACILLCRYKWSVNSVHEAWFSDEEAVRKSTGLFVSPNHLHGQSLAPQQNWLDRTCGICFEISDAPYVACGHRFCTECWTRYMETAIEGGLGCLNLRCPEPSCDAAVGRDMVNRLVNDVYKVKYDGYLLRSYVDENRKIKWCPAPGCEYGVQFDGAGVECYDASCLCSHGFCWNCTEETHRPVDCDTVAKWIQKNSTEAENVTWILAYTKPCPKCKRPIEKNKGCMHMTCNSSCGYQFCWLCLGEWRGHTNNSCNRFRMGDDKAATNNEAEKQRELAKKCIERYTHYYERWAANQSSRMKALSDLHNLETVNIDKLSKKQAKNVTELEFVKEAWVQIIECRRVLKWTYAYGYYLPENEQPKKQFFEYLQGEAEKGLEKLHHLAEKELGAYLEAETPSMDFSDFRMKLAGLTSVTRTYFENLVEALENGLSDVASHGGCTSTETKQKANGKRGREKGLVRNPRIYKRQA